ncbi:MAG: methyltransferase domain-containing protein, partial [Nitrososphaerales archaeon]
MTHIKDFFIKPDYVSRDEGVYFEDSRISESQIVHPSDVYALAGHIGRMFGCTHILDIGCGRGQKLAKLHPEFNLVGVDFGSNISFCNSHYPFGQWFCLDLEESHRNLLPQAVLERTIVICSDVIEHLADPTGLLTTLNDCLKYAPVAVLTTLDRDLVRGLDDMGPPANPAHAREWNQAELLQLFKEFSFNVAFIGLTCNNGRDCDKKTILSILHGNSLPRRGAAAKSAFRVIALMTAYNEEDIVFHSVKRLIDNGVDVYLIDNWSSDGTVAAIEPLLGKGLIGIERFPADEATGTFDLQRQLARVEELTQTLTADWFIHHDVDEIRESPWPNLSLKAALQYADQLGFNAIDHTVIDFRPIDNCFISGTDFGNYFSCGEFGRRPGHFHQIKAWKNLGQPPT